MPPPIKQELPRRGERQQGRRCAESIPGNPLPACGSACCPGPGLVPDENYLAAAGAYSHAIQHSQQPEPEHYLARAEAIIAAGPEYVNEGLESINEGLDRLGEVLTLELRAVDLEVSLKRYQAAFDRLDRIRKKAGRQEFWLERQGQILDVAGRVAEAQVCYEAALVTSQSRAPRLRNTQSSQELEGRLRQKLNLPASTRKGGC